MPTSQLISRGLRKAPVKKTRIRWTAMAATKTSAAQWCTWRMTSPALDLEREVQHRCVRARDLVPGQRRIAALVGDGAGIRHVEEGQEDAGRHQDHQAEERHLAQQERPVVGEDLAQAAACPGGRTKPFVHPAKDHQSSSGCVMGHVPERRPHRLVEVVAGDQVAVRVHLQRQLRQRARRRSEDRDRAARHVEGRLVARAEQLVGLRPVEAHRAAGMGADLGVGHGPVRGPGGATRRAAEGPLGRSRISRVWLSASPHLALGKDGADGVAAPGR